MGWMRSMNNSVHSKTLMPTTFVLVCSSTISERMKKFTWSKPSRAHVGVSKFHHIDAYVLFELLAHQCSSTFVPQQPTTYKRDKPFFLTHQPLNIAIRVSVTKPVPCPPLMPSTRHHLLRHAPMRLLMLLPQ